jgi:hypothetical protein
MKRAPLKQSEKDTQRSILEYLAVSRIFHWRNNTGAFKTESGGFYHFGTPGSPDIIAVHEGRVYGIEVKGPNGKLRPAQEEFKVSLEKAGGIYIVARSTKDAIDALPEHSRGI